MDFLGRNLSRDFELARINMIVGFITVFCTWLQVALSVHDSLNFILHPGRASC